LSVELETSIRSDLRLMSIFGESTEAIPHTDRNPWFGKDTLSSRSGKIEI